MYGDFTTENSLSELSVPRETITEVIGDIGFDAGNPLPKLTRIVGNLSLRTHQAEAPRVESVTGMAQVMGRAKSLKFVDGSLVVGREAVLDHLMRVGEDLFLHEGAAVPALVAVGKDVMISGGISAPRLAFVGGMIDIENMSWFDPERAVREVLPALRAEGMGQATALQAAEVLMNVQDATQISIEALMDEPDQVRSLGL